MLPTRPLMILTLALAGLTALSTLASASAAKVVPFAALMGPYSVGTTQLKWTDQSRPEAYSSDPARKRRVTVQVWYPIDKGEGAPDAPYLLSPKEFDAKNPDSAPLLLANEKFGTRSFLNAPVARDGKRFPVLIFNAGGQMSRFTSSFVTEQLASKGYVVFALEHYGYSKANNYPDGTPLSLDRAPDTNNPAFQKKLDDGTATAEELVEVTKKDWQYREDVSVPVALLDNSFVLGRIEKMAAGRGQFAGRLDLGRIGTLGWSQGGATSVNLLVHDERIKATVDLDGQLMGAGKETWKTSKPFLLLHNSAEKDGRPVFDEAAPKLLAIVHSWFNQLLGHSTGFRGEAYLKNSDHGNFSDYLLLYGAADPGKPEKLAHAREREIIVSKLTVEFFEKHLRGLDVKLSLEDPLLYNVRVLEGVSTSSAQSFADVEVASAL